MKSRLRGFTLIEVMITVAIVAILAAIALPSYSQYVRKTRREDAKESLLAIAALQERWFFTNNSYTKDLTKLGQTQNGGTTITKSKDGYYRIEITTLDADIKKQFTLKAEIINTGLQKDDTDCAYFEVTQTGAKLARKDGGSGAVNTDVCWGK